MVKNSWKGLMFGAFIGAAIGLVLDVLESGRDKASGTGARLKVRAHEAVGSLEEATHRAGEWVKEKDVPGKVRSTVEDLASSAPVERVRQAVDRD
jgi:hypothetical protein